LGSLSEAIELFDPQQLYGIIESLSAEVEPVRDVRHGHVAHMLSALAASVVKTLKSVAQAPFMNDKNARSDSGLWLHTDFTSTAGCDPNRGRPRLQQQPQRCEEPSPHGLGRKIRGFSGRLVERFGVADPVAESVADAGMQADPEHELQHGILFTQSGRDGRSGTPKSSVALAQSWTVTVACRVPRMPDS
jgi:hypothetical protein